MVKPEHVEDSSVHQRDVVGGRLSEGHNLWVQQWRTRHAQGDVIITRFSDDFVVGFQHRGDADRFLRELRERLQKFSLELHPDKTRVIEFGRYAASNQRTRVAGKLEHFHFLGFLH